MVNNNHSNSMLIEHASVATPKGVIENASVKVEGGKITAVGTGHLNGTGKRLDAHGLYLLPGFVDLHCDAIEWEIQPRPTSIFPYNMAIIETDKKVAAAGITSMYHSFSYRQWESGVRNNDVATEIIREVNRLAPKLGVRTRVHARFEITSTKAVAYLAQLLTEGNIQLFSIMDHTPGQGQLGVTVDLDRRKETLEALEADYIRQLVEKCHSRGIPVASHDDDTEAKLDVIQDMGIGISEFPVNLETAVSAFKRKMHVLYGAPNIYRGTSTGGNLSAREAILKGYGGNGGIICSDYAPAAMLHAVFTLEKAGLPLHQAVNMASLNPARAVGISDHTGSLEVGKSADLILVDASGEVPRTRKTFVAGSEIYSTAWPAPEKPATPQREAERNEA